MMRRKLKNRVAAQNARDKKRVKMDGMEDALRAMKQEMDRIRKENKRLIELNERLLSENQSLKSIGTTIGTNLVMKEEMPPSPLPRPLTRIHIIRQQQQRGREPLGPEHCRRP